MVVEVLGTLCVGVAHQSNQTIQIEIANADALPTLVNILRNCNDPMLQVIKPRWFINFEIITFEVIDQTCHIFFRTIYLLVSYCYILVIYYKIAK